VSLFYVVYIDEVFIVNFIMDMILLEMVRRFRGLAATVPRLLAGASEGAAGTVFLCIVTLPNVLELLITLVVLPLFMIFTAFHTKNIKSNILNLITLYLNSAMTGGIFQMIFYHTTLNGCLYASINAYQQGQRITPGRLAAGIVLSMAALGAIIGIYSYKCCTVPSRCTVALTIHGRKAVLNALVDTGNRLYEPVSRQPVCILYYPFVKKYFDKTDMEKLRIIPVSTVGGGQGWLYAVLIDKMEVCLNGQKKHFEKIYIALDHREFAGCQCLLHPDYVQWDCVQAAQRYR